MLTLKDQKQQQEESAKPLVLQQIAERAQQNVSLMSPPKPRQKELALSVQTPQDPIRFIAVIHVF